MIACNGLDIGSHLCVDPQGLTWLHTHRCHKVSSLVPTAWLHHIQAENVGFTDTFRTKTRVTHIRYV